jgi:hypothetical protein
VRYTTRRLDSYCVGRQSAAEAGRQGVVEELVGVFCRVM